MAFVYGCKCIRDNGTNVGVAYCPFDFNDSFVQNLLTQINTNVGSNLDEPLSFIDIDDDDDVYLTMPEDIYLVIQATTPSICICFKMWTKAKAIANKAFQQ